MPWLAALMVLLAIAGTALSRKALERIGDAAFLLWTRWTVTVPGAVYLTSGVKLYLA